jgi:hypothetical protein
VGQLSPTHTASSDHATNLVVGGSERVSELILSDGSNVGNRLGREHVLNEIKRGRQRSAQMGGPNRELEILGTHGSSSSTVLGGSTSNVGDRVSGDDLLVPVYTGKRQDDRDVDETRSANEISDGQHSAKLRGGRERTGA